MDEASRSVFTDGRLKWLFELDRSATTFLYLIGMENDKYLRRFMKLLEWSIHGYGWSTLLGYCLCTTKDVRKLPFYLNTSIGLWLDMIIVGVIKVAFRRPRPEYNQKDMVGMIPYVDDFSFPSMHSSRSAMITKIVIHVLHMNPKIAKFAFIYPLIMALSRVMLGRHHLTDVMVGLLIGLLEGQLITTHWLSSEICLKIVKKFRTL